MSAKRHIPLGARKLSKPKNVATLKPYDIIQFVHRVAVQRPEWFDQIKQRVNHDDGRPRRLSVETLVGAALAVGVGGDMLVRDIASLLRGLDAGHQRLLGVRWIDTKRGCECLISERQVEYLFTEVNGAFTSCEHSHALIVGEFILAGDGSGEIMGLSDQLTDAERAELACDATCPAHLTLELLGNQLLALLRAEFRIPQSSSWALDSYVIGTHFATKSYGAKADIDPNWVSEKDKDTVEPAAAFTTVVRPRKTKKSKLRRETAEAIEAVLRDGTLDQDTCAREQRKRNQHGQSPAPKTSRRPARIGPTVSGGKISTNHPDFPQLRPDGRLANTKDPGAASAYVGAGASRKSAIRDGRDKHVLVASGLLPDGTPFPPFAFGYACVPGGDNKGNAAMTTFANAKAVGVTPGPTQLDRIYTAIPSKEFEQLVNDQGWTLVRDLKEVQRTLEQDDTGVWYLDGWWFTSGIQPGLLELPRPAQHASNADRAQSQARYDKRRPFAFRSNGQTSSHGLRLRGPAYPDSVERDAHGRVTAVTGVRVRCINSPYYHLVPQALPETACVEGEVCGCSANVTIERSKIPSNCEPLIWGTTKWAKSFYRRNLVEAFNSVEEFHQGVNQHSIRVRGEKWDLAHMFLTAGTLLQQFYNWLARLGAHALDPAVFGPFDADVIVACMARVLKAAQPSVQGSPPTS